MASVSVSFMAPVNTGGISITSYTVTSTPGNFTATGAGSPIVITGLTGGTSYTFTVHATNANGDGPESVSSNAVTPIDVPGSPTNIVAAIIPGVVPDPYYSSVSLLLHGDGTNGSTTIVDSSSTPKILTASGGAAITTTQYKFGTGSIYFDGVNDSVTTPSNASLDFGTGDFTIEVWYKKGGAKVNIAVVRRNMFSTGTGAWGFSVSDDGTNKGLYWVDELQGGTGVSVTGGPSSTAWTHYAVCRASGVIRLFIDGVSYYSGANTRNYSNTFELNIGKWDTTSTTYGSGYLDDLRITTGVARYTTNFTPPTISFPDE